ncbi:MAG TPA: hypothetical protein VFB38_01860 [Chthonomonadaceae bacterium]|nr:hypothetical protein [Chthonomonadaceae bacterium]
MAQPKVYEGTWEELSTHADEFRRYPKLTLIVPGQELPVQSRYRAGLTPEERIQALDAAAEKNCHLPALPPEAFERESLYADEDELP